jgi:hypothetical protein
MLLYVVRCFLASKTFNSIQIHTIMAWKAGYIAQMSYTIFLATFLTNVVKYIVSAKLL